VLTECHGTLGLIGGLSNSERAAEIPHRRTTGHVRPNGSARTTHPTATIGSTGGTELPEPICRACSMPRAPLPMPRPQRRMVENQQRRTDVN
jgi:hypothetical protein